MSSTPVELTNRKVLEALPALRMLSMKGIPRKTSYTIGWNMNKLQSAATLAEAEHKKIIDEFGVRDDKGEVIIKDGICEFGNKKKEADKQYDELMAITETYELRLIDPESLDKDGKEIDIEPYIFATLHWLFTEEQSAAS